MPLSALLIALLLAASWPASCRAQYFEAYFANWARYHQAPYTYTASDLAPIVDRLHSISYSFVYFCPPPGTSPMPYWAVAPYGSCTDDIAYQLMSVEPADFDNWATINGYKTGNPKLKLVLSVGGWNFPSAYFSAMAADPATRSTFIQSCLVWMSKFGIDGLDLDWEFPCSPAREDDVEIDCGTFRTVQDAGGRCPDDTANVVSLLKEMRQAFGPDKIITIASQAAKLHEQQMSVGQLAAYVDYFHVMTYDYSVSDIVNAGPMAPNAPLYNPQPASVMQMSINYTVQNYVDQGVSVDKIMIGVPLYAHMWFNPSLASGNQWMQFGNPSVVQGACCGPFAATSGAKPGPGSSLCGTYMYSELLAAAPQLTYYDNVTQSAIAYWTAMGADGYTAPGTWATYNDVRSVTAIANYAKAKNLRGVFIFDTSMDTVDASGAFTYELMNTIASTLG